MPISHLLCNVESFRVTREGHGVFGDELRIAGWFLSHAKLIGMDVVFADGTTVPVDQTSVESEGVWHHHGEVFGDVARHCRFYTARKVPDGDVDLSTAILRIRMENATFDEILGAPEGQQTAKRFSPEEGELVMSFESIGDNCEFGLMQRTVGFERMGLLRYAGIHDLMAFVALLQRRFEGFCEGDDLKITTFGPEWIADIASASLNIHTGRIQGLVSREQIETEERLKLQFLANKMMDDLEDGQKTFVYRTIIGERGGPDGTHGMDQLYGAMRSYGDCALLWVTLSDGDHPHASVEHVRDRLYRGYIRRLCPYDDAHSADERAWLDLLAVARATITGRTSPRVEELTA